MASLDSAAAGESRLAEIRTCIENRVREGKQIVSNSDDFASAVAGHIKDLRETFHRPDLSVEEARAFLFRPWDEAAPGLAFLDDRTLFFKGSDGQLYQVQFAGEDVEKVLPTRDLEHALRTTSPFTLTNIPQAMYVGVRFEHEGFLKCLNLLRGEAYARTVRSEETQASESRASQLNRLGI